MRNNADTMSMLDLIMLKNIIEANGLPAALLEQSDLLPLNTLIVDLPPDYQNRARTLSYSFMPMDEEYFPDIKTVQAYSEFNFEIAEGQAEHVQVLIARLNRLLVMGSLGVTDNHRVYYRYVQILDKYESLRDREDVLLNVLNLILFALNVNAEVLEDVAIGKQTVDKAFAAFIED